MEKERIEVVRVKVEKFEEDVFSLSSHQNVLTLESCFVVSTDVLLGKSVLRLGIDLNLSTLIFLKFSQYFSREKQLICSLVVLQL